MRLKRRGVLRAGWVVAVGVAGVGAAGGWQAFGPLDTSEPIGYHIAPGEGVPGYRPDDELLARWALEAWRRASRNRLAFRRVAEDSALIRVTWGSSKEGSYGAMRQVFVGERRGAIVHILADTRGLGAEVHRRAQEDSLFRDVVVYLTCLHELGHALGLVHTRDYQDIMYFFGYGGHVPNFFQRYRDRLETREDIRAHSGLSANDVRLLRGLYGLER